MALQLSEVSAGGERAHKRLLFSCGFPRLVASRKPVKDCRPPYLEEEVKPMAEDAILAGQLRPVPEVSATWGVHVHLGLQQWYDEGIVVQVNN